MYQIKWKFLSLTMNDCDFQVKKNFIFPHNLLLLEGPHTINSPNLIFHFGRQFFEDWKWSPVTASISSPVAKSFPEIFLKFGNRWKAEQLSKLKPKSRKLPLPCSGVKNLGNMIFFFHLQVGQQGWVVYVNNCLPA